MEKIAFLFPGQGSQFVGMSQGLYDQYSIVKQTYEEASDMLGYDLAQLSFEGPLTKLTQSTYAQTAILVSSVSCFRVYMQEFGIVPQFLAGHSLGEYSALTCSGAIRFSDAVKLVHYRGKLTDETVASGAGMMTIIDGVERATVEAECRRLTSEGKQVWISCYNSQNQVAISGDEAAVLELEDKLSDYGAQITPLLSSAPFHSYLMKGMADKLTTYVEKIPYGFFKFPIITNSNAQPLAIPEQVSKNLIDHILKPVRWEQSMLYLKNKGVTLAIEMGAKNVLTNLLKSNVEEMNALCFGVREDRKKIEQILSQYSGLRKHIPTVITRCLAVAAATPNKNWDNEEYEAKVSSSYRRIQEIQDNLTERGEKPSLEQMKEALDLLKVIMATKKVPIDEQMRWIYQIIDETGMYYVLKEYIPEISSQTVYI